MLRPRANFGDGAVIDRACRARKIGEDVLIVWPAAIGDHRLDEGDLPAFELVTPLAHRHGRSPVSPSRQTPPPRGRRPWLPPWRRRRRDGGRGSRYGWPVLRTLFASGEAGPRRVVARAASC